jgi:hypothetical protein
MGEDDDLISTGIYWDRATWDLARSAYIADLDTDPDGPGSFVGWLDRALDRHTARSPSARVDLAAAAAQTPPTAPSSRRSRTMACSSAATVPDRSGKLLLNPRVGARSTPQAYPGVVFTEQHTPEQVTTYEVAREMPAPPGCSTVSTPCRTHEPSTASW